MNTSKVINIENDFKCLFKRLCDIQSEIRERLEAQSDGKKLKGNELVGWLGEIYGKILLGGCLVSDQEEHDFVTQDGNRISVKARKGYASGWKQSSAIPNVSGDDCPTHLLFVHLKDDYSVDRMWLFEWPYLISKDRFKRHIVRGSQRSFIFILDECQDKSFIIFDAAANTSFVSLK